MHQLRYLIGLLTLVSAIAAAVWIVRLLRSLDERPGVTVSVEFHDARGLRPGADVRFRGVTVGAVRSVVVSGDGSKAVGRIVGIASAAAVAGPAVPVPSMLELR